MPTGDSPILVTGGTGTVGRPTVERLRAAGREVRVLSRQPGEGRIQGDLATGEGLEPALAGVGAVVHLAYGGSDEAEHPGRLAAAAAAAGVDHLLYISIVGIDGHPFSYYRRKVEAEEAVRAAGVPWTILRATQFHDFVPRLVGRQRAVVAAPKWAMQPIAVGEVAERLVELVEAGPSGRVAALAGPEQGALAGFARVWFTARGRRPLVWELPLPGASGRALRAGAGLGTLPGAGRQTFAEWARAHAAD